MNCIEKKLNDMIYDAFSSNRKGGTSRNLRSLNLWIAAIIIWMIMSMFKFIQVRNNYTELHRRVTEIEKKLNEMAK